MELVVLPAGHTDSDVAQEGIAEKGQWTETRGMAVEQLEVMSQRDVAVVDEDVGTHMG